MPTAEQSTAATETVDELTTEPSDESTTETVDEPTTEPTSSTRVSTRVQKIVNISSTLILATVLGFLVLNLRPWLWFADNTPTGGDLGAHVWAPAYLRDVLLSDFRLTGWSHDWYAGFPAFTFYMVIPSLLVVIVNAGIALPLDFYAHTAFATAAIIMYSYLVKSLRQNHKLRALYHPVSLYVIVPSMALLVAQTSNWLDGKALTYLPNTDRLNPVIYNDSPFDLFLAALVLPACVGWLVWNSSLFGGNLYIPHILRRRKNETSSPRFVNFRFLLTSLAVLATSLVTPIPYGVSLKLVAVAGIVLLPIAAYSTARLAQVGFPGPFLASAATLPFLFDLSHNIYGGNIMSTMAGEFAFSLGLSFSVFYIGTIFTGMATNKQKVLGGVLLALTGLTHLFAAFFALTVTVVMVFLPSQTFQSTWKRIKWAASAGGLAFAFSAWWVLPFWWNRAFLNDMGWGKEKRYLSALWSRNEFDVDFLANHPALQVFVVLAVIGAVLSIFRLGSRLTLLFALTATIFAVAFVLLPEGRLWNTRLLPFYYLSIYFTAFLAVSDITRLILSPVKKVLFATLMSSIGILTVVGVLIVLSMPLRILPGGHVDHSSGIYQWGPFQTSETGLGPSWLQYNYEGYEDKLGYQEYLELVQTMNAVADRYGCGNSLWEYERDKLSSYGTPMAPMLLPFWTNQCIGSMEGLYFESSSTTPYHFLMQSELSTHPSQSQRDLLYPSLNVASGVEHMQLMGVQYYMAFTSDALEQARSTSGLTEIAQAGPWVVFLVDESEPVTALNEFPVVVENPHESDEAWLEMSVAAFLTNPSSTVLDTISTTADTTTTTADTTTTTADTSTTTADTSTNSNTPLLITYEGPDEWPRLDLSPYAKDFEEARNTYRYAYASERENLMVYMTELLPEIAPRELINNPPGVSNVEKDNHKISFSVDRVGSPVLVRTSYFPNWVASGAEGPYRVSPNLMVVIPQENDVTLYYSRTPLEIATLLMLLAGICVATYLTWRTRTETETQSP